MLTSGFSLCWLTNMTSSYRSLFSLSSSDINTDELWNITAALYLYSPTVRAEGTKTASKAEKLWPLTTINETSFKSICNFQFDLDSCLPDHNVFGRQFTYRMDFTAYAVNIISCALSYFTSQHNLDRKSLV